MRPDHCGIGDQVLLLRACLKFANTLLHVFTKLLKVVLHLPLTIVQVADGLLSRHGYALNSKDSGFQNLASRHLVSARRVVGASTQLHTHQSFIPSNSSRAFNISRESRMFCLMRWISGFARNQYDRFTLDKLCLSGGVTRESRKLGNDMSISRKRRR